MSQASSSFMRSRQSTSRRVWQSSTAGRLGVAPPPQLGARAPHPLEVVPPPVVDDVTGLPLILCPRCKDLRLISFTCRWTENCGIRFFKCPRNNDWVADKCGIIMSHKQYEQHLECNGYLGKTSLVYAVPDLLMKEVEQVNLGLHEMKEELAMVKIGMDEMKIGIISSDSFGKFWQNSYT